MKIKDIIEASQAILDNHLEMSDEAVCDQISRVKADALTFAGYPLSSITEATWVDFIEADHLEMKYHRILIELDDCLDFHNKTRFI
jgi:hypothetical protein